MLTMLTMATEPTDAKHAVLDDGERGEEEMS
jgi:hypothetical protein